MECTPPSSTAISQPKSSPTMSTDAVATMASVDSATATLEVPQETTATTSPPPTTKPKSILMATNGAPSSSSPPSSSPQDSFGLLLKRTSFVRSDGPHPSSKDDSCASPKALETPHETPPTTTCTTIIPTTTATTITADQDTCLGRQRRVRWATPCATYLGLGIYDPTAKDVPAWSSCPVSRQLVSCLKQPSVSPDSHGGPLVSVLGKKRLERPGSVGSQEPCGKPKEKEKRLLKTSKRARMTSEVLSSSSSSTTTPRCASEAGSEAGSEDSLMEPVPTHPEGWTGVPDEAFMARIRAWVETLPWPPSVVVPPALPQLEQDKKGFVDPVVPGVIFVERQQQ